MAPRRIWWWVLSLVCFYAAEKRRRGWGAWAHEVGPGLAPGASCPGLVYPPSGVVLGADDALHLTVAVHGCTAPARGAVVSVLVNSEVESTAHVDSDDFVHDFPLYSLRLGFNQVEVQLLPAEEPSGGGGQGMSAGSARQDAEVQPAAVRSTFVVTWEAFATSYIDAVLAYETPSVDAQWPFVVGGKPFLLHHAKLVGRRPQLTIDFPSPDYVFKKMSLGPTNFAPFLRLNKAALEVEGGVGVALRFNGGEWMWYGMAYFVALPLSDGAHSVEVALTTPDGAHRVTAITTLRFSINQTLEYEEDGGGKEGGVGVIPADASLCPALVDSLTRPNAPVMTAAAVDSGCRVGAVGECGRGECVDAPGAKGVCVCEPDIIGLRCSHSLLEDLRYLPAEDPRLRVRTDASCGETLRHEQLALHLAARIEQAQWPSRWEASRVMHLSLNDTSGFGVTLHLLTQALSAALRHNKTLVVDGKFSYFRHRGCAGGGRERGAWSCMFQQLHASCPRDILWASSAPHVTYTANYQLSNDWHVPTRYNVKGGGGVFFFVSQLSAFVMSPNRQLMMLLRRVKRAIGFLHPIMAVHVRHGDSCPKWEDSHSHLPGAKCEAFARYVEGMMEMHRLYGVTRTFVCTDDPSIIEELPQAVVHTGVPFEWVHLPFDRALFAASDWAVELKLLMATMDRRLVAETTVLDILLMSEADYVIGTLSSHFGALAYELSVSSKGFHVPYISLDFPWRSSLLSPVSYYDDTGTTRDRVELNLNRRDFFQHKRDAHEPV